MIPALHRLHFGQTIREEGPTWHSKKNGTPTMGGLCFILGILATLGIVWVMYSPKLPEVLGMPQLQAGMLVLFLAFGSGLIGFLDDFIKVVRHRNLGLTEAQKALVPASVVKTLTDAETAYSNLPPHHSSDDTADSTKPAQSSRTGDTGVLVWVIALPVTILAAAFVLKRKEREA